MKVCAQPGCSTLVHKGRCAEHASKPWDHKGRTAEARGYDATYRQARRELLASFKGRSPECWICTMPIARDELEVDHIKPLSEGGTNDVSNLAPAHRWCNRRRMQERRKGGV